MCASTMCLELWCDEMKISKEMCMNENIGYCVHDTKMMSWLLDAMFIPFRHIQIRLPDSICTAKGGKSDEAGTFLSLFILVFFLRIFSHWLSVLLSRISDKWKWLKLRKNNNKHFRATHRETECAKCIVMHLMWCKMWT